jgi:hypothetical protein
MDMVKKILISYLEIPLSILAFLVVWYLLGHYALGGPLSNDSIAYMNAGLNHVADTYILNRYFHVFLMAVFLKLAPMPLTGFQYYWAFLLAATALLVYYNARYFTSRSNFIHGFLAVGIFFSFRFFATYAGMAGVDMTTMFMVMVIVTVFMVSVHRQHQSKWILVALGFLFFLGFKTKETTLVTGILFIGLGFQDGQFRSKVLWKQLVYVAVGLLGGIVFFALLNWIMLGDPLFGLRLSNIREFLSTYVTYTTGQSQRDASSGNWYTAYLLGVTYIPFVLYLISGIRVSPDLDPGRRLVWWLPLASICFVSLTTSIAWGPRFLLLVLPLISLLGPQFLDLTIPAGVQERIKTGAWAAIALGLLLAIRLIMHFLVPRMGLDASLFYVSVYETVTISIILAISFLWKRFPPSRSLIIAVLIVALIASPVFSNARTMLKAENRTNSNLVFYPYAAFSGEIHFSNGMQMYVSLNAWGALNVSAYCKSLDGVVDLFNIYFDASSKRSNFTVPFDPATIGVDVVRTSYTYILMSKVDWQAVPEATRFTLEQRYNLLEDRKGLLVFLKPK